MQATTKPCSTWLLVGEDNFVLEAMRILASAEGYDPKSLVARCWLNSEDKLIRKWYRTAIKLLVLAKQSGPM